MTPLHAAPAALCLALAAVSLAPQQAPRPAEPAASTRIVFHESPAIDLYFHVRAIAAGSAASEVEAFQAAVAASKELDQALGGFPLAWGPIEGQLPGCRTAADVAKAFARAPETLTLRSGQSVPVRDRLRKLSGALIEAEPAFLAGERDLPGTWSAHSRAIALARARWDESVAPKERALFEHHLRSLGMEDAGLAIPVYLTLDGPAPGAVTHLDEQGRGVCFVAVDERHGLAGSQLFETVLHEATHALDVAAYASVLNDLRKALEAAGIGRRERAFRDLPHTLMFVQGAESIRRVVAPEHRDSGDVSGYYGRVPGSELVRGFWGDHLEGKLSRAEAVAGIVAGFEPAPR